MSSFLTLSCLIFVLITASNCFNLSTCPNLYAFYDENRVNEPISGFYSKIEAEGGSTLIIFTNLEVECYSKINYIYLFQALPALCVNARLLYEIEIWKKHSSPDGSVDVHYDFIYKEYLRANNLSNQFDIYLNPNKELVLSPGDVIGFRNSTLNFLPPPGTLTTYVVSFLKHVTCRQTRFLHIEKLSYGGELSPLMNIHFIPQLDDDVINDFYIDIGSSQSTSTALLLYHRGIAAPVCHYLWHITTADLVCQSRGYSHASQALIGLYTNKSVSISSYYWLDYLFCSGYEESLEFCKRSSWQCISNCTSDVIDTAAGVVCGIEETRPRLILTSGVCLASTGSTLSNYTTSNTTSNYNATNNTNNNNNATDTSISTTCKSCTAFLNISTNSTSNPCEVTCPQIFYAGSWHNVSGYDFSLLEATLLCRKLGYDNVLYYYSLPVNISIQEGLYLKCNSDSANYADCSINNTSHTNQSISDSIALLACSYSIGSIALYNSINHSTNIGELRYARYDQSTYLSYVCTDYWTAYESSIVCRELGFQSFNKFELISASDHDSDYWKFGSILQFDSYHLLFKCYGHEAGLSKCITNEMNSSYYCNKYVVKIWCDDLASHDCYDFNYLINSNVHYEFKDSDKNFCYQLVDILGYINSYNSILNISDSNFFINSYSFKNIFLIYGSYFFMSNQFTRFTRALLHQYPPCFILYFNPSGLPVALSAPINKDSPLNYSSIYMITESNGIWTLSGNLTQLITPIEVSTMHAVCRESNITIESGHFIILESSFPIQTDINDTALTNVNSTITALFSALEAEFFTTQLSTTTITTLTEQSSTMQATDQVSTTPTQSSTMLGTEQVSTNPPVFTNSTNTTISTPTNMIETLLPIYRYTIASTVALIISLALSLLCSILCCAVCLYMRKQRSTKLRSNALIGPRKNVYSINNPHYVEHITTFSEEFTHVNRDYHLFKIDPKTSRGFLESTKSLRHTIKRVGIQPKFYINSPEVKFPIVNANKCKDLKHMNEWYIDRGELVYLRELGLGYFGKVQLMLLKKYANIEELPVAVKTLSTQDPVQTEQFMGEMLLMIRVQHKFIVSIIGMCPPTADATPLMILEYFEFGDLKGLITEYSDKDKTDLNILHLFSMAENIASAVSYLSAMGYIHRDIAARNCLVGYKLICKLSDFGLTWSVNDQNEQFQYRTNNHIPIRWTSPESIFSGNFSFKSDVWSYGVLLWEMFTYGMNPLEDLSKSDLLNSVGEGSLSMPLITNIPELCNILIQSCCCFDAEKRPTIQQVHSIINTVLEKITELEEKTDPLQNSQIFSPQTT